LVAAENRITPTATAVEVVLTTPISRIAPDMLAMPNTDAIARADVPTTVARPDTPYIAI
jgi:hypothetical protein